MRRENFKTLRADTPNPPLAMRLSLIWDAYRWPIVASLAVFSVVLGYQGFRRWAALHQLAATPLDSLYLSLQLFPLQSGNVSDPIPVQLEVARLLSPFLSAYAAFATIWLIFREQTTLFRLRFFVDHVVVCGLGRKSLQLIEDLRDQGQRVVVIEKEEDNFALRQCQELGAITLVGNATDYWLLQKARVHCARYLISTCGEDGTNVEVAVKAGEILADERTTLGHRLHVRWRRFLSSMSQEEKRRGPGLRCLVHIADAKLRARLERQDAGRGNTGNYRLQFFNIYQDSARLLLEDFPPDAPPGIPPDMPRDVLIIGFGRMGERVFLQLARTGSFGDDRRLHLTVMDRAARARERTIRHLYPQIDQLCSITFHELDTSEVTAFENEIRRYTSGGNRAFAVYVCLDSDAAGLECALALEEILRGQHLHIVVRMEQDRGLASVLHSRRGFDRAGNGRPRDDDWPRIEPFGVINRVCRSRSLLRHGQDFLAQAIHRAQCCPSDGDLAVLVPSAWEDLSEDEKNVHRELADHIPVKLRAVACEPVPSAGLEGTSFEFSPPEVELLARMEHARWRAEHVLHGWRYSPMPDRATKGTPHLVPWAELPEAVREQHRRIIGQIPQRLAEVGLAIVRKEPRFIGPVAAQI